MASFKKYLLIDPVKYEELFAKVQLHKGNDILVHPNIKAVKTIDNKMSSILNDDKKSDLQKIEEYSTNLESYLRNFKNALEISKRDAILGENKHATPDAATMNHLPKGPSIDLDTPVSKEYKSEKDIPLSYRPTATHLTSFLNRNNNFEVKNQELKYKGKKKFQSDFSQLLNGIVRFKKPSSNSKSDIDEFVSLLRQEGYPVTRLGYVRRNNTKKTVVPEDSSSRIVMKKKTSKLQNTIERLCAGSTPSKRRAVSSKSVTPSKIYEKWENV